MTIKNIFRIGKQEPNKRRPIKVIMNNEGDKNKVLMNLTNLKGLSTYVGISVTEDYTINERNKIKMKAVEAKRKNEEEGEESNYVWRVRGTPKNGLEIKRLLKKKQLTPLITMV